MPRTALVVILFLVALPGITVEPASAEDRPIEIGGPARVLDGDTLEIGAQRMRIVGIDAPENDQDCGDGRGGRWNCGAAAEDRLRRLVANGVRCAGSEFDAYRRLLATCRADGQDVAAVLVNDGLALAYVKYSDRYVREEKRARTATRGVWRGEFTPPWEWRRLRWQKTAQGSPSPDCPIKGNVSPDGTRIYHAPWSRSYARTRIDTSKGERWFCDEAEALAAGWRAPRR